MSKTIGELSPGPVKLRFSAEDELGHLTHTENVELVRIGDTVDGGKFAIFEDIHGGQFTAVSENGQWFYETSTDKVEIA